MILSHPLQRNPVPSESRSASADPTRGFPIRWLVPSLTWLPYLPAVVTYHYPIFRSMERSPGVVSVEGGFAVDPLVASHWSNVESIMRTTIDRLRHNAFMSHHQPPSYPSSFGYRQTFRKRKAAKDTIKPSFLAFHHLLAYCSYIMASTSAPHFSQDRHRSLYENPAEVSSVFDKIVPSDAQDSSHILLKLLWSTLGEIRQTRNFSGVVVTHDSPFDCQSLQDMHLYGVPVFIRWSNRLRLQTYSMFPNNSVLAQWRPTLDSFSVLDQPQDSSNPDPATLIQQLSPPPPVAPLDKCADRYPWEYVETRKAKISSTTNKPQSWLARETSAKSFRKPGRSGALVYQFNLVGVVEEGTGKRIQKWERSVLTRAEAQLLWSGIDPHNLWYCYLFFSFSVPFLNQGSGMTASMTSGTTAKNLISPRTHLPINSTATTMMTTATTWGSLCLPSPNRTTLPPSIRTTTMTTAWENLYLPNPSRTALSPSTKTTTMTIWGSLFLPSPNKTTLPPSFRNFLDPTVIQPAKQPTVPSLRGVTQTPITWTTIRLTRRPAVMLCGILLLRMRTRQSPLLTVVHTSVSFFVPRTIRPPGLLVSGRMLATSSIADIVWFSFPKNQPPTREEHGP